MIIRELMSKTVQWTTPTASLAEAARRMRENNIGCLPVGENNNFIGMLTEKDFATRATAEGMNPNTTTVRQIMTSNITYCQDDDSAESALHIMEQKQIHHLPVRNKSNQVVGLVSLSDLALKGPAELLTSASRLAFQTSSSSSSQTGDSRLSS